MRQKVTDFVSRLIQIAGTRGLVALAVVGSAARSEETWLDGRIVGDIDIMAIVRSPDPFTKRRVESVSRPPGFDLGCFPLYTLSRYRTLEFFEARMAGWIVWGDQDVFRWVRMRNAGDIPEWEGLRLLLNRTVDCVKARAGIYPAWYGAVKTYLALAEADLILQRQDMSSYQGRWKRVEANGSVFGSIELFERIRWATRVKLGEENPDSCFSIKDHESWLLFGIKQMVKWFVELDVSLYEGMALISRKNKHWIHRLVFLSQAAHWPGYWPLALFEDPVFIFWRSMLQILEGRLILPEDELHLLLKDFGHVMQPLLY